MIKLSNSISGIYKITNITTRKCYIGSAINIRLRWGVHRYDLRQNKHHSKYLQRSWNKYGFDNFMFEILFTCPKEHLIRIEQYFINNYKPEYNALKIAGSRLGRKLSKESIAKLIKANTGKKRSIESKKRMSDAQYARKHTSNRKPIYKIDMMTHKVLAEFSCIKEAGLVCKLSSGSLSQVALGKRASLGGYLWKFKKDYDAQQS